MTLPRPALPLRGILPDAVTSTRLRRAGILRPTVRDHYTGNDRFAWTHDDAHDAAVYLRWRTATGDDGQALAARALDLWRAHGRPPDVWVGTLGGRPIVWTHPAAIALRLRHGHAIVAVPTHEPRPADYRY